MVVAIIKQQGGRHDIYMEGNVAIDSKQQLHRVCKCYNDRWELQEVCKQLWVFFQVYK